MNKESREKIRQEFRHTRSISVVFPTRNRAQLLNNALESLLYQTYPADKYEVIVVDNGSTDNTKAVASEFEKRLPGFRYAFSDEPGLPLISLRDIDEVPTIEEHSDFTFIIIRIPYNSAQSELTYFTQPLGIFLHDEYVITISMGENQALERLVTEPFEFSKSKFVLRLLLKSSKLYLTYLKEIHKKMISLEEKLGVSQKNKIIMDFLELEKSLVYFSTSLKSNQILIEELTKSQRLLEHKENIEILDQIAEELKQGIQMTEVYSNILSNTLDAFASIISNNLNIVMKTLTSLTLIFSIPILIVSAYGMNIELPFEHSPHAFIIVLSFSLIAAVIATYIFAKKRFF